MGKKQEETKQGNQCCRPFIKEHAEFSNYTSLHGFVHLSDTKSWIIRILWIPVMLACLGFLIWQLFILFSSYLNHDTITSVNPKFSHEGGKFPCLTVCSELPINTKGFEYFGLYINNTEHEELIDFIRSGFADGGYRYDAQDEENFKIQFKNISGEVWDYSKIVDKITERKLEKFIRDCQNNTDVNRKCKFRPIMTEYGRCFTIDSLSESSGLMQTFPGSSGGVTLVLDLQQDTFIEATPLQTDVGVKVYIHNIGEPPHLVKQFGIGTPPKSDADYAFTVTKYHRLGPPYGDCTKEGKLEYMPMYSYRGCTFECMIAFSSEDCSCRYASTDFPKGRPVCEPREHLRCVDDLLSPIRDENHNNLVACRQKCKPECDQESFDDVSVSYTRGPTKRTLKFWADIYNEPIEYMEENFVKVNIFFKSLEMLEYETSPAIPFVALLSNIGGLAGLCFGFSLLSFFELFLFYAGLCCCKRGKRQGQQGDEGKDNEEIVYNQNDTNLYVIPQY